MRKSCWDCVKKHLGSAGVFLKETKMGYPAYDIWVIGELEHAADECLEKNRDLAMVIREHRVRWMEDHSHFIPFEEIGSYVSTCVECETSDLPYPQIPDSLQEGLEDENGKTDLHGDTRP